jgi:hypothetical protein
MKTLTKQQAFTYVCLFALLASRILVADITLNFLQLFHAPALPESWSLGIRSVQDWTYTLFFNWSFILIGILIIVNRNDLQSLNIDGPFAAIFAAGSLTYWAYYRWPSGWIALLMLVPMYILNKKREFRFAKPEPIANRIGIILVIVFFLSFLFTKNPLTIKRILSVTHFIVTQVPGMLVAEIIFRGLLWKFLTDLNWSAPKIIGLQAFLFWLSLSRFMFTNPIIFWIIFPIISVLLGIIVWRSKSISGSLFALLFYGFFSAIY